MQPIRNELSPQLRDIIDALESERRDLLSAIETLKRIHVARTTNRPVQKKRGRKFMNAAERREVSERMRQYWTARREGREHWRESEGGKGRPTLQ